MSACAPDSPQANCHLRLREKKKIISSQDTIAGRSGMFNQKQQVSFSARSNGLPLACASGLLYHLLESQSSERRSDYEICMLT